MNYQETLTYLYNSAPLFQQVGKDAYKEGLDNTYALDDTSITLTANSIRFTWQEPTGKVLVRIHWLPFYRLQAIRPDFTLLLIWWISVNVSA